MTAQPLKDKVALVTGAGRGIGAAAARALAAAGAKVVVNDLHQGTAAQVAAEIVRGGGEAIAFATDVSDRAAVEAMVAEAVRQFGRLDVVVCNAVYSKREPFYEANLAEFERTVNVSMWGAFHALRAAVRQMIAQGSGGSAVIVSSPHAVVPVPLSMAYNMAKAAIDQMARTAAIELAEHRIRVNIVHPGWTDTPGERRFATDETIRAAAPKLPWKRLADPAEIGRGIVFLCDPASDYITGSTLKIDGGITLPWWASRGSGVPE
ncbi:MAG TPA: SDR family oxidoreductase [Pirellulales bacterium]|jgi:glucose 1-dehydrogenase|nr:SDR family oxidoreductase [Pirellulales bacterium]